MNVLQLCRSLLIVGVLESCLYICKACDARFSFSIGPYKYHVVSECHGNYTQAVAGCSSLGGVLGVPRHADVIQILSDYAFNGILPESDVPLNRRKRSKKANSAGKDDTNTVIDNSNSPPTAETTYITTAKTTSTDPTETKAETTAKATVTRTTQSTTPAIYSVTYWTGTSVQFPDIDPSASSSGTCGMIEFIDNPLSDSPQINWLVSNDCDEIDSQFPWVCETIQTKYSTSYMPDAITKTGSVSSIMDYRPTAVIIGSSGIIILLAVFVALVLMDVDNVLKACRNCRRHKCPKQQTQVQPKIPAV